MGLSKWGPALGWPELQIPAMAQDSELGCRISRSGQPRPNPRLFFFFLLAFSSAMPISQMKGKPVSTWKEILDYLLQSENCQLEKQGSGRAPRRPFYNKTIKKQEEEKETECENELMCRNSLLIQLGDLPLKKYPRVVVFAPHSGQRGQRVPQAGVSDEHKGIPGT